MLRAWLLHPRGRWGLAIAVLLAAGLFLYSVRAILPPFLLAAVLAYTLAPLVEALHRQGQGLSRGWAILLIYALAGLLAGAIIAFVVPLFILELDRLAEHLPVYFTRIQAGLHGLEARFDRYPWPETVRNLVDARFQQLEAGLLAMIRGAVDGVFSLLSGVLTLVLAPILAFYFLNDLPHFRRRIQSWLPPGSRPLFWTFLSEVDRVVAGFIRGQLIVAACVGLLTAIAMSLLGVRFALVLGIIAAITDLIPYFGPVLGAVPAVALAGMESFSLAIKAAIAYTLVQQVESAILVPRIVGRSVGLHPLAIVFAILVGGKTLGLLGMVAAVPVAALLRVTGRALLRWAVEEGARPAP